MSRARALAAYSLICKERVSSGWSGFGIDMNFGMKGVKVNRNGGETSRMVGGRLCEPTPQFTFCRIKSNCLVRKSCSARTVVNSKALR